MVSDDSEKEKVILEPPNSEEKNQELLRDVTKIAQYTGKGEEEK